MEFRFPRRAWQDRKIGNREAKDKQDEKEVEEQNQNRDVRLEAAKLDLEVLDLDAQGLAGLVRFLENPDLAEETDDVVENEIVDVMVVAHHEQDEDNG